jgi:hypothetical protein
MCAYSSVTPRGLVKNAATLNKITDASSLATTKIVDHYSKFLPKNQILLPEKLISLIQFLAEN